jgi:hypothetical protein
MTKPQLYYDMLKGVAKKLMALGPHGDWEERMNRDLMGTPHFKFMVSPLASTYYEANCVSYIFRLSLVAAGVPWWSGSAGWTVSRPREERLISASRRE